MRAIVLDFYCTLTDPAAEGGRRAAFAATAAALGVPADDFWAAMSGTFRDRIVGRYGGTRDTLRAMAARCGATVGDDTLDAALTVHRARAADLRPPRPEALAVLDELRGRGWRTALISDCASELVESWAGTPYAARIDVPVFSWRSGCRKPDPRLYAAAAAGLGVPAEACWYVGDGGGGELAGARAAGMRPVLVTNAAYPGAGAYRVDADPYRPADAVDDLTGLLNLCGHPIGVGRSRRPVRPDRSDLSSE
ncbi:HAD family hydrolase [Spirilliplanes yamanashiensis]|uniref:HAD family hydrolase n=1 Tax=Spirilliplanes yamanashiensis TaxID=42233 RepID=UPI00194ECADA|nr:HAD family hydrolase [Spirilliplanes yamanashiensis]MDP9818016.1 putative hydrolase of the HAD superfamily [Spirilliplanes yamanashiensis]